MAEQSIYALFSEDSAGVEQRALSVAEHYQLDLDRQWHLDSLQERAFLFTLQPRKSTGPESGNADLTIVDIVSKLRADHRVADAGVVAQYIVAGKPPLSKVGAGDDPYHRLQHAHATSRIDESHQVATGRDVKVAIIDTGIDNRHLDLQNQIEATLNFVDADQSADIVEFHATAVAGIIGAEAGNDEGILGVAPEARLYALRACVETDPGKSRGKCNSIALARALDWAIVNQMQVINMSLHGQRDPLVTRLIQKAVEQGAVVIAATELRDGQLAFPASLEEVIAVSDQESNSLVGLAAHSQRIFIAPGEEILTTMPANTYDFVTGASFATAHVAGIVALILEKAPDLTALQTMRVLRESVRVVNWGIIVDSCAALARLDDAFNCRRTSP